jgi:hypothetical protein
MKLWKTHAALNDLIVDPLTVAFVVFFFPSVILSLLSEVCGYGDTFWRIAQD